MSDDKNTFEVEYDLKIDECPCGSGLEPEDCCGPVKSRTYTARLDPRNYHESDGVVVGLDRSLHRMVDGKLQPIIGQPQLILGYSRKGKSNKVVFSGASDSKFVMNPDSIFVHFKNAFFLDTNTRLIHGSKVSVCGVVHAYLDGEMLKYIGLTALEFWDAEVNPELLGWSVFLEALKASNEISTDGVAVVGDAFLGDLREFNARAKPLFGEVYLPEEITLLYASADKRDFLPNKLMKEADRMAKQQLDFIEREPRKESLKESPYPCRFFRQWTYDESKG